MRDEELYSSGIFASELDEDDGADTASEQDFDEKKRFDDDDDDDLGDDENDSGYNPFDEYKTDEWG